MNSRVTEFQCIMPLENIPSVLKFGILSNEGAAKLQHRSVAMEDVQEKRDLKHVPGGLKLHQYANLYFHARNPMLYKRRNEGEYLRFASFDQRPATSQRSVCRLQCIQPLRPFSGAVAIGGVGL